MPIFGPTLSGLFSKPTRNSFFSKKLPRVALVGRPTRIRITDGVGFSKNLYKTSDYGNRDWYYRSDDFLVDFYRYSIDSSNDELALFVYSSTGDTIAEMYRVISRNTSPTTFPSPLFPDQYLTGSAEVYADNPTVQILELSFSPTQSFVYDGRNAENLISFTRTPATRPGGTIPITVRRSGSFNIGSGTVSLTTELADYILPNDNLPQSISVSFSKKPVTAQLIQNTFTYSPTFNYGTANAFSITGLESSYGDTLANSFSNIATGIPANGSDAGSYVISFNPNYTSPKYNITNVPANVTWEISKANQTIAFTLTTVAISSASVNLSASSTSALPVSFSVQSGPGTITNGVLTFSGTGNVVIRASQSGNANFNPASTVDRTIVVSASPVGSAIVKSEAYDIYIQGTENTNLEGFYANYDPSGNGYWGSQTSSLYAIAGPPAISNYSLYNTDDGDYIDVYNDSTDANVIPETNWKKRDGSAAPNVFVTSPARITTTSFPIRTSPSNEYAYDRIFDPAIPKRLVLNGFNCPYGDFRTMNLRLVNVFAGGENYALAMQQWYGLYNGHTFVLSEYAVEEPGGGNFSTFSYRLIVFPSSGGSVVIASRASNPPLNFQDQYNWPNLLPNTFPTTGWNLNSPTTGVLRFHIETFPFPDIVVPSTDRVAPNAIFRTPAIWLRPDTGVTLSGSRISQWASSGSYYSSTFTPILTYTFGEPLGPLLANNVLNGYPVARFDLAGISDTSDSATGSGLFIDLPLNRGPVNNAMTYIFVWKNDPTIINSNRVPITFYEKVVYHANYTARELRHSFTFVSNSGYGSYVDNQFVFSRGAYAGTGWGVEASAPSSDSIYAWDRYSGDYSYDLRRSIPQSIIGGTGFKVYSVTCDPAARVAQIRVNGILKNQVPIGTFKTIAQKTMGICLGRTTEYGNTFAKAGRNGNSALGDLAEFIYYDNSISIRELKQVTNHLLNKYAIV